MYETCGEHALLVFLTRVFLRFARRERLDAERLCNAVTRAERGAVDANLGGSLIKQRVVRPGGGRSGGTRTVIAYRAAELSVFLYGFDKNERDNISDRELDDLKKLAKHFLSYTNDQLATAVNEEELREIVCDAEEEQEDRVP
jgi:hypothetical protein